MKRLDRGVRRIQIVLAGLIVIMMGGAVIDFLYEHHIAEPMPSTLFVLPSGETRRHHEIIELRKKTELLISFYELYPEYESLRKKNINTLNPTLDEIKAKALTESEAELLDKINSAKNILNDVNSATIYKNHSGLRGVSFLASLVLVLMAIIQTLLWIIKGFMN